MLICQIIFMFWKLINNILLLRKSSLSTSSTKTDSLFYCQTIFKTLSIFFLKVHFSATASTIKNESYHQFKTQHHFTQSICLLTVKS